MQLYDAKLRLYCSRLLLVLLLTDNEVYSFGQSDVMRRRTAGARIIGDEGSPFHQPISRHKPQLYKEAFLPIQQSRTTTTTTTTSSRLLAAPPLGISGLGGTTLSHRVGMLASTTLRGGAVVLASAASKPPALQAWIGPALLCALSYALYNLFIKKAAMHQMDPLLGGVVLQSVAALAGSVLYGLQQKGRTTTTPALPPPQTAVMWAVAAGLAVGAAELLSFYISGLGVQSMQSIPVVIGGSVLMGTVLGRLWLKEVLSWKGWCGVALISLGIALVGIDPGSGGGMH